MPTASVPTVTALIPTFRRPQQVQRAIQSVLAQEGIGETFDLEVFVMYDRPSDLPPRAEELYPEVGFLKSPDPGFCAKQNVGIAAARGDYIAFLDDDDLWLSHRLRVQVPVLEADAETGVIYGQGRVLGGDSDGELWPKSGPSGRVLKELLVRTDDFFNMDTLLVRREALQKVGGFDETLTTMENYDIAVRLAAHYRFRFLPGAVSTGHFSEEGHWYATVMNGEVERVLPKIVERGLEALPPGEESDAVRRRARVAVFSTVATHRLWRGGPPFVEDYILEALAAHPWMINESRVEEEIRRVVSYRGRSTTGATRARRAIWRSWTEIRKRTADQMERRVERRLRALVYLQMSMASARSGQNRIALRLARMAIASNPRLLRRPSVWKRLIRPMVPTRLLEALRRIS